ncbi:TIGR03915 family putative DNA repair protein [Sphingobacterium sp. SRCM116780]|uniref:TIGR03915 family putative DNA repair protein n=1 Tax=Sphingobacterium sp. SRCM116780 TaxID=2907623 RepID=UPI001F21DF8D|nr:TIGR03915 family putative DNA repair protein [Sphingobacterium sp. SRCM116780]UIR57770.1 TIGR03915 family putative DNA repair protein [Sphingobacterium sp. SRCM116780]
MLKTLIYDGTWAGLLTTIFCSFEYKWQIATIQHRDEPVQSGLFVTTETILTDELKTKRVLLGLEKKIGLQGIKELYYVFLSECKHRELLILRSTHYYFKSNPKANLNYAHDDILKIKKTVRSVSRERHRMTAFVRFQKMKDGLYFANIEPDFNVLPLIANFFKDRFADQKWLIYDLKRKYGIYYDLQDITEVKFSHTLDRNTIHIHLDDDELHYSYLWKNYFDSVNIKERKNTKLHVQSLPKRYWKYLNEKNLF